MEIYQYDLKYELRQMKYSQLIYFTLFAVIIMDIFRWLSYGGNLDIDSSTYIATIFNYLSIAIFIGIGYENGFGNKSTPKLIQTLFKLWLFINLISLVIGFFTAKDYWDWKFIFLSSISFSLISLAFFVGNNLYLAKISFGFVLKILFPFGFLLIPISLLVADQMYSRIMIPVSLFMLFIPFVKFKWGILIVLVAFTSMFMSFGFRTNLIKTGLSLLFLLIYYRRNIFSVAILKVLQISLFIIPIVLVVLAALGNYNFFADLEKNNKSELKTTKNGQETNLLGDTRTFLYQEVLLSLANSGNYILGEGAAGKYQSKYFDYFGDNRGRYGSEVGILNILLYDGIVGVVIYFLLLFSVSYIAIARSNNYLSKMLGLFIASRFLLSFIEEFTQYDINFYFFWIAIGLVSSTQFRAMSDQQLKTYFLFDGTKKSSRTPYLLQQED